jgi:hypothetical protein
MIRTADKPNSRFASGSPLNFSSQGPHDGINPLPRANMDSSMRRTRNVRHQVVHAALILEVSMTTSSAVDEPVCRSLPAGCHGSDVLLAVLARHALSLDERPSAVRPAVATRTNDCFDVAFSTLESV